MRRTPEANDGDLVVTRMGQEIVLKRFHRRRSSDVIELQPESTNPDHKLWTDDGEIRVMHTANAGWMGRERKAGALMKRGRNPRRGCLQHTKARSE